MIAFSKLSFVTISFAVMPFAMSSMSCFPALYEAALSSGAVDGMSAVPGSISPSASAIICIVDAVPMNEQAPQLGHALCL